MLYLVGHMWLLFIQASGAESMADGGPRASNMNPVTFPTSCPPELKGAAARLDVLPVRPQRAEGRLFSTVHSVGSRKHAEPLQLAELRVEEMSQDVRSGPLPDVCSVEVESRNVRWSMSGSRSLRKKTGRYLFQFAAFMVLAKSSRPLKQGKPGHPWIIVRR